MPVLVERTDLDRTSSRLVLSESLSQTRCERGVEIRLAEEPESITANVMLGMGASVGAGARRERALAKRTALTEVGCRVEPENGGGRAEHAVHLKTQRRVEIAAREKPEAVGRELTCERIHVAVPRMHRRRGGQPREIRIAGVRERVPDLVSEDRGERRAVERDEAPADELHADRVAGKHELGIGTLAAR